MMLYFGSSLVYTHRSILSTIACTIREYVNCSCYHKRNHLSITDYYSKMTHYANELAASGFPLRDDELVAYLLVGLDEEYNSVFTVVVARVNPISPSNWYAQLLNFKQHTHLQAPAASSISSSTMMASRGRGLPGRGVGGSDRDHGRSHFSRSHGRSSSGSRS
jgi:hypothetical protein